MGVGLLVFVDVKELAPLFSESSSVDVKSLMQHRTGDCLADVVYCDAQYLETPENPLNEGPTD